MKNRLSILLYIYLFIHAYRGGQTVYDGWFLFFFLIVPFLSLSITFPPLYQLYYGYRIKSILRTLFPPYHPTRNQ